jgi:hypothetical protein
MAEYIKSESILTVSPKEGYRIAVDLEEMQGLGSLDSKINDLVGNLIDATREVTRLTKKNRSLTVLMRKHKAARIEAEDALKRVALLLADTNSDLVYVSDIRVAMQYER